MRFRFFLMTATLDYEVVHRAYALGVSDYIQRPISPYIAQRRIKNVIELFRTRQAYSRLMEANRLLLERLSQFDDVAADDHNP